MKTIKVIVDNYEFVLSSEKTEDKKFKCLVVDQQLKEHPKSNWLIGKDTDRRHILEACGDKCEEMWCNLRLWGILLSHSGKSGLSPEVGMEMVGSN